MSGIRARDPARVLQDRVRPGLSNATPTVSHFVSLICTYNVCLYRTAEISFEARGFCTYVHPMYFDKMLQHLCVESADVSWYFDHVSSALQTICLKPPERQTPSPSMV